MYSVEFAFELPEPSQQPTTWDCESTVKPGGENPLFQTLSYSYPTMPGMLVPFVNPVPGVDPVARVLDDVRVALLHLILVHHAEQPVLGLVHERVAPARRHDRVVHVPLRIRPRCGVRLRIVLVAHLHAVRHAGAVRLEPDLPVRRVRREERSIHSLVDRVLDVLAHPARPVLVVADRQPGAVVRQRIDVRVGVDVGRVRDVVPLRLHPPDHRVLEVEVLACAVRVLRVEGPVERHLRRRRVVVAGPAPVVVEAQPAPLVVRLVRRDARLEVDRLRATVVPDDEEDVARAPVRSGEAREVDAGHPVRRDVERRRLRPVLARHHAGGGVRRRNRLVDTGEASRAARRASLPRRRTSRCGRCRS